MGPVAKVVLANRQSKPAQKTSLLALSAWLRSSFRTHAGPQTHQPILELSILLKFQGKCFNIYWHKSPLKIDITPVGWGWYCSSKYSGQMHLPYVSGLKILEGKSKSPMATHPRAPRPVVSACKANWLTIPTGEIRRSWTITVSWDFWKGFWVFAWIAARSMSSRLMVALVEDSMIANKTRKGRWWDNWDMLNWEMGTTLEILTGALRQDFPQAKSDMAICC